MKSFISILIIFFLSTFSFSSQHFLFDKYYFEHYYKDRNLVIFYKVVDRYIDETFPLESYIDSYIENDTYLDNRNIIFVLTDRSKLVYYIAYLKNRKIVESKIEYSGDDNKIETKIDKYNVIINIGTLKPYNSLYNDLQNVIIINSDIEFDIATIYLF